MKFTTDLRIFLFLSLFLGFPFLSYAFQEDGTAAQDSVQAKKPEPISVNRLVKEMEELRSLINLNNKKIVPTARLKRIDSLYPVYKELIADEEAKVAEFLVSNPNKQKINNLIKRWEEYRVQLGGWETEITAYVDRNLRLVKVIGSESVVWELTYERAISEEVPKELLNNVREVINDLKAIDQQTKDYNYTYLRLQTRINRLRQTVVEMMQALYDKRASETYDLFHQRHIPIWQVSLKDEATTQESGARPETLADPGVRVAELFQTHKEKLYFLIVLGLGLAAFIMYLKKQLIKTLGQQASGSRASTSYLLFRMPAVVVAFILIFTGRLQLLEGTRFLGDILLFIMLLFAIFLIMHKIPRRYRGLLYFSILLLVLDSIKTYVWFESIDYRMFMLAEAILMTGAIFYYTRPYLQTRQQMTTPIGRFIIRLVPLVYFLCAVSVVSNILGYTNLSDLTLKVCTQSGIAAIIAYALLLAVQSIFIGWLDQRFHRSAESNQEQLAFLKKRTGQFLRFTVIFLFVIGFLNIIDELRTVTEYISDAMTEPYVVGNLTFTLGSIFMFLLILVLSYISSRLVSFLVSDDYGLLYFFRLPEGIPTAISLVLRYSIIVFGVILALSYLNVDLSQFNLMAGALGLGIGFGLQTVISNFVSGLILVFERPILPGDTIEVNNLFGKVSKIGVRASSITTYDGAEVVVPNMNLISNDLINWTLSDSIKRIEILVGTTYGADPNQVLEILRECAADLEYAIKEKDPLALFTEFGESSLNFRLLFWVPFEKGLSAKSDVSLAIYNKFKAAGIEIPFPQRDVHIKSLPGGNHPMAGSED
ncbi:MAG: mechanosensitive ion channel [Flavobacteriaceae bacterium]|jgi:small-conductance mechanosensitive channel|nr:MAG: mechanosensitive ion channel [Flavobacteriaceae bacterium]